MSDVRMEVTRPVPRGGITLPIGRVVAVPAAVAEAWEQARPPYGVRCRPLIEEGNAAADATPRAREAANHARLDLEPLRGRGSGQGGRITLADVRRWTPSPE